MISTCSPLVSIITATYNHEEYVGACIESVLRQTYENWEQIIIDDGSTDRTAEIVRRYRDGRIKYVCQQNRGIEALAQTYNQALTLSKGSLIAILEGDDTWPGGKLRKMVPVFSAGDVVLAYGEMQEIDPEGNSARRISRTSRTRRKLPRSILFNDPVPCAATYMLSVHGHSLIPPATVVIRRSALEAIGGFQYVPNQCFVDFPTFIRLVFEGKFVYLPEVMGHRRMHSASATVQHVRRMATASREHLSVLLRDPRFSLTSADRKAIEKDWQSLVCGEEFALGRLRLLEKRWRDSRSHFSHALRLSDPRTSASAVVGWILSWLHCDLEVLFRLAGRAPQKAAENGFVGRGR